MGKPEIIRDKKGRVVKGVVLNPAGRPVGPNKITIEMKTIIEQALHRAGQNVQRRNKSLRDLEPAIAYMVHHADTRPDLFLPLVRQLMPAKIDLDVSIMNRELVTMLSARRDQLAQLRDITPTRDDDDDGD